MSMRFPRLLMALTGVLLACSASATTYEDNFTGKTASLKWTALDDACLTAGDGSGTIPACSTKGIHTDSVGQGALVLTPNWNGQTGAILSAFAPFPLSQGLQVTFTTYTYAGDSGGTAHNGADGIVFFLTDGTQTAPTTAGALGGSMGYDCSNVNGKYDGIAYGYLGLGIDEFGNYLNTGDNASVGIYNSRNSTYGTTAHGDNSYQNNVNGGISSGSGPQYQPERIGLRGSGNTNWAWLNSQNPNYYMSTDSASTRKSKVQTACRSGEYVYTGNTNNAANLKPITYNYNAIPGGYAVLPDSEPIANNSKSATRNPTSTTPAGDVAWPITYRLTISPGGLLNFDYSYNNGAFQPVLSNEDITKYNGPLPASLRFGFSAGTGGSNNYHEITCFKASPLQANSSAGSNTVTGKVTSNTQFFLASYSSNNWWGSLVADPLIIDNSGNLSVGTNANWDAKCVLTGDGKGGTATCDTMGLDKNGNPQTGIFQAASSRTLLTSDATGSGNGVALAWSNLSGAQQTVLNKNPSGTVDNQGQQRVEWLQGVRSVEQLATPTPGNLRARTYVLGDIINSSPTFVGAPTANAYADSFYDQLYPTASNPEDAPGAKAYSAFVSSNAGRPNVVYVGGNDGFMHGFRAGAYTKGVFDSSTNDGKEVVGYMPYDVLMDKAVNLADPNYSHDYLVDATPVAGDVFYNKTWHTWLVGGVGTEGKEIYALDVTDPSSFGSANVIGDWDNTTLTHLGNTVGTPIIKRMHDGQWAIIFGSGLVDAANQAAQIEGVYVGLIDPGTGAVTFKFLSTGQAPTGVKDKAGNTAPGGIAYVSSVDLDGDNVADYLYAGDTQGRVWRFDVTSNTSTTWTGTAPLKLFTATDSSGNPQPITTSITVLAVQTGLVTRDMLYFGTGQYTPQGLKTPVQYSPGSQTFYGIWDSDMDAWNALQSQADYKYASLTAPPSFTRSDLLAQTLQAPPNPSDTTHRYLSNTNVVCWKGDAATTACPSPSQYGWRFDLPDPGPTAGANAGEGEQVIYNPTFIGGAVVVNTAIPPEISAVQCNPGLQSGWTMAFDPASGGGFPKGFFPDQGGGFSGGKSTVSGVQTSGVGTPTSVQHGGKSYLVTQTITGAAKLFPINPQSGDNPARVSWRELVNP